MPRSAKLFLSAILLLPVLAVAAAVLFRIEIANRLLPILLTDAGLTDASGRVTEIGLHRTVLRDLRLGGDEAGVARIEVGYRPRALLGGRIDEVTLDGPRLRLAIGPEGVDWGGLAPLLAGTGDGESTTPAMRIVGPVRVENAQLAVATPWGKVAARLVGEIVLTEKLGTTLDIAGLQIEDRAARPRFAPLSLTGRGRIEDGSAGFDGQLATAGGKLAADLAAQHDLGNGAGRLTFELPRTVLGEAGIEVETVAPVLAGQVTGLDGSVAATGQIEWRGGDIAGSRGELRLDEVGFATLPAEVAGLDGIIEFSSLLPPATPPGQRLDVAFLDPGVPLVDGEIVFQLKPGPVLAVERAAWPFAGGTLVSRGTEIDLAAGFEKATLDVEDVAISSLLDIVAVDDLSGTGRLSGKLPLVVEGGTPAVRGARLAADQGVIRYGSEQAAEVLASQGGSAELVAKALRNFHYDRLVFTADGPLTGEIVAGIELDGANPELYGGKPIELNVTLQGDLRPLIQSASVIKDLPERIRRQIEGGGAASGKP